MLPSGATEDSASRLDQRGGHGDRGSASRWQTATNMTIATQQAANMVKQAGEQHSKRMIEAEKASGLECCAERQLLGTCS